MLNKNPKAKGGLSAFFTAKNDNRLATSGGDGPWTDIWKARKNPEFRLKTGQSSTIVFLTDIMLVPSHKLVTHWVEGQNFPATEWIPSTAFRFSDTGLEETGRPDIFGGVLGKDPKMTGIAVVLDLTPYTKRDGTKVNWSVRPLLVDSEATLSLLAQVSINQERNLEMAAFQVTRSTGDKSPRTGDTWVFARYTSLDKIQENSILSNITQKDLTSIKLSEAYPVVSDELAARLLKLHARVVDKHEAIQPSYGYDSGLLAKALAGDFSAFGTADAIFGEESQPIVNVASTGDGLSDINFDDDEVVEGDDPYESTDSLGL